MGSDCPAAGVQAEVDPLNPAIGVLSLLLQSTITHLSDDAFVPFIKDIASPNIWVVSALDAWIEVKLIALHWVVLLHGRPPPQCGEWLSITTPELSPKLMVYGEICAHP